MAKVFHGAGFYDFGWNRTGSQSDDNNTDQLSSEISDLLLFVSYFTSQSEGIKFGNYFFDVC